MANGGFTFEKANQLLDDGYADIISFGTMYISHPDLVELVIIGFSIHR